MPVLRNLIQHLKRFCFIIFMVRQTKSIFSVHLPPNFLFPPPSWCFGLVWTFWTLVVLRNKHVFNELIPTFYLLYRQSPSLSQIQITDNVKAQWTVCTGYHFGVFSINNAFFSITNWLWHCWWGSEQEDTPSTMSFFGLCASIYDGIGAVVPMNWGSCYSSLVSLVVLQCNLQYLVLIRGDPEEVSTLLQIVWGEMVPL